MSAKICFLGLSLAIALTASDAVPGVPRWFEASPSSASEFILRSPAGLFTVAADRIVLHTPEGAWTTRFAGASKAATLAGTMPTGAIGNYFLGQDAGQWRYGVLHYSRLLARNVYPGIDVAFYLNGDHVEYDFILASGADPNRIAIRFEGAGAPVMEADGSLRFKRGHSHAAPNAYQTEASGRRSPIASRYVIARNGDVQVRLGDYDRSRPLIIDPILYSGFIAGDRDDRVNAMTVDRQGNLWMTGSSISPEVFYAGNDAIQGVPGGARDIFLARFAPQADGSYRLNYWTLIGGSGNEEPAAIATDGFGFVYLAGYTDSANFPRAGTQLQASAGGSTDAFLIKVDPNAGGLTGLAYSQFYGGAGAERARSIAVSSDGTVYLGGYSASSTLPGVGSASLQSVNRGGYDAIFLRLLPSSSSPLSYATFLGGNSTDIIESMAIAADGGVVIAGYTNSSDFPITDNAFDKNKQSAFLGKINLAFSGLDALEYGTFFGGNNFDQIKAIAIDPQGLVWFTGYGFSTDLPVTADAIRSVPAGSSDIFLGAFDFTRRSDASAIRYLTYLGGSGDEIVTGISLASSGRIALSGYTYSPDFPLIDSVARPAQAPGAAFAAVVEPFRASGLILSTTFGGTLPDVGAGVAFDARNRVLVGGYTYSRDFAVTDNSVKKSPNGVSQGFLTMIGLP